MHIVVKKKMYIALLMNTATSSSKMLVVAD